ncbi:MAG: ComF family protein [Actinomycetota bacterium]
MLDLVLPQQCGGCGAPATAWCTACAEELAVRPDEPHLVTPRLDPGVPVFSLGRYAGARRQAVVAAKERGRTDLLDPLGQALAAAVVHLLTWGLLDTPLTLVPAPTRRTSARRRGGDPVTRLATHAARGLPGVTIAPSLRLAPFTRDSVGLSSAARQSNIAGRIRPTRGIAGITGDAVLVDDIVTTGATATESTRVLQTLGVAIVAVLVVAHA